MKFAVIGAGGVGAWLGARLEQAGSEVIWIVRGAMAEAMGKKGLTVKVNGGEDVVLANVQMYPNITAAAAAHVKVDCCLVCTKAYQVEEALQDAVAILAEDGFVCTTQNGIEAPNFAALAVGPTQVVAGSAKVISFIAEPGIVQLQSPGIFTFGEVFDFKGQTIMDARSARVQRLWNAFRPTGITINIGEGEQVPSMWRALWSKAISMSTLGPVTAATRASPDACFACPETKEMLRSVALEIAQVAAASGCRLAEDLEAYIDNWVDNIGKTVGSRPGNTVSTTRDVLTGKPSEIGDLVGAIVRAAKRVNVPVPTNATLLAVLLPQERRARKEYEYTLLGIPGGIPHVAGVSPTAKL